MSTSGLPVYNVVADYSADKTGVNDATQAIQNAISAASVSTLGGTVFFPSGTYKLTAPLDLYHNVKLIGEAGVNIPGVKLKTSHFASFPISSVSTTGEWFEITGEQPVSANLTVSSITRSGTVATTTTSTAHGLIVGQSVVVSGATQTDYNGTFLVTAINSSTVFTYTVANSPTTPATGTITAVYGVGSITRSLTVATVTTPSPHRLAANASVTIAGASQTDYNGTFTVTVTGLNTFTYTVANSPATPATGTITVAASRVGEYLPAINYAGTSFASKPARKFIVSGSTGNNGQWEVSHVTYDEASTKKTRIYVTGNVTNATGDGVIQRHYPAIRAVAADYTGWAIKNMMLDFSNCKTSSFSGSLDNQDTGIELNGGWLYTIEDVNIQYAHYGYHSYLANDRCAFMGRVSDVETAYCRNGFKHWEGTCMIFDRCWTYCGNATAADMDIAYDFRTIWGLTLNACAIDHWTVSAEGAFKCINCHGVVINGMDNEDINTNGSSGYYLQDSDVVMNGCSEVRTILRNTNDANTYFIRGVNSAISLSGCKFGNTTGNELTTGGNSGSKAIMVGIDGNGVSNGNSSLAIAGCNIQAPTANTVSVVSITRNVNTATVTVVSPNGAGHGLGTGESVTIAGANESDYNGTFSVTVTGIATFTYTVANSPTTPATGTITALPVFTGTKLAFLDGHTSTSGGATHKHAILATTGMASRIVEDDTTAYAGTPSLLVAGNNADVLYLAGDADKAHINLFLKGSVDPKATIQGVNYGTNGGLLRLFIKPDGSTIAAESLQLGNNKARFGFDQDGTTYSPVSALQVGYNNVEALGVASKDVLTNINFYATDGASNITTRRATIQAAKAGGGSNYGGALVFFTKGSASAGTDVSQAGYIGVGGGGLVWGNPTGGDKGPGTINASAVYDDGTLLTDWVFDLAYDGKSELKHAKKLHSLEETMAVTKAERRLPWMPKAEDFEKERSLGSLMSKLVQGQEQQQLYIAELEARIKALEGK